MKTVIRADSGTIMGSGHIMRCLVVADGLASSREGIFADVAIQKIGSMDCHAPLAMTEKQPSPIGKSSIIFACRKLPGNIISVIESRGYSVKILPELLAEANIEFINFLKQERPKTLIIDNYDTDIGLESDARNYAGKIIVVDDLANRKHDCDILLDQNPCPITHARYNNLVPQYAIKLLGLKFALLGKEFINYKKNITTNQIIKNILIFFGGGDHKNLTEKVLNYICHAKYGNIHFNVVVGNPNPNKDRIMELCEANENFTFHCQINNMAALMADADLFIGAGGTTSWERMCVGLPAIIISIAENQEESCHELAKLDLIKYLGTAEEFTQGKLLDTLNWIEQNPQWLYNATKLGQQMVDGLGAKRLAAFINSLSITLEKAGHDDCENIFNWRNHAENRRYSINNNEIDFEGHKKWFTQTLNNNNRNLLIAQHNNQPIGVVRFDYEGNGAEISLYLVPDKHSKGFGLPLLLAAENWLKNNNADISQINAKVLFANEASKKIFGYALYNEARSSKEILLFNKRLK